MTTAIAGIVRNGVVVPGTPLPEGARVEIHLQSEEVVIPEELQLELAAWQRASANALALVEDLAQEGSTHETR